MLLLLALSGIEKLAAAPYGDARETLAAKLRALLSPAQRDAAAALLSKVALDVPDRSSHPAPFLDALAGAAQTGHWVAARYRSESRGVTTDVPLLPVRPSAYGGFWYCEAHAHERGGERRTYRVDRFEAVESTGAPPGAQLAAPTDYGDPSHPEVRVALSPRGVALAEREPHTGGAVSRHADGSGAMVFRCPPSELPWWAGYFFRLGVEAEVVAPPDLRARVYALACAMAERYSRPPANGDRLLSPFSG